MHQPPIDVQDLGPALAAARDKLDAFERKTLNRQVLVRLRARSPFHPFLVVRALAMIATILMGAGAVAVMLAPMNRDLAIQVGQYDAAFPIPLPAVFGVLAGCCLLFAFAAHLAALVAGRSAPLLAHEARVHQRLVSDVKRLEAQMAVSARLTPRPPRPRLHASH